MHEESGTPAGAFILDAARRLQWRIWRAGERGAAPDQAKA
jgi:hypothetical protein